MQGFSRLAALLVVFGSVWMHGVLPVAVSAHDMKSDMGMPSCLSHCLATIHADSTHNVTTPSVFHFVVSESSDAITFSSSSTSSPLSTSTTSHHDPWQILTTIRRE